MSARVDLNVPVAKENINKLRVGDQVFLTGRIATARDAAHRWMVDHFIKPEQVISADDEKSYSELKAIMAGSFIYHCGPIVRQDERGNYAFVAAGPTTSIREELYQADVIRHFDLRGVIGKGGMGQKTSKGLVDSCAVYLHAIGGLGAYYASCVSRVVKVYKLEFGVPEAMWVIDVVDMPLLVTMDAHGDSLHDLIAAKAARALDEMD